MPSDANLKLRAVRGFGWVLPFTALGKAAQFLAYMILAKLLAPEEFGTFALALVVIEALYMFREMGMTPALIQKDKDVDKAFGVGLILLPVYGFALYFLIFFLAPAFGKLVNNPDIVPLIRVIALSLPISSLGVLPCIWFQREIDFKRKSIPELIAALFGALLSISLAYFGYGVWSLAFGRIGYEASLTISFWLAANKKWKPQWDWREARILFKFGGAVSVGSALISFYYIIDKTLVGKYFGEVSLGFYSFAFKIGTISALNLILPMSMVMLPVMTRVKDNTVELASAIGKNSSLNAFITTPISLGIILFSRDLLHILYGEKWDGAILLLQIFAIYSFFWSAIMPRLNALLAVGKARVFLQVQVFKIALAGGLSLILIKHIASEHIALIFTATFGIFWIYSMILIAQYTKTSVIYFLREEFPYLASALICLLLYSQLVKFDLNLGLNIIIIFLVYSVLIFLTAKTMVIDIFRQVKRIIFKQNQSE